MKNSVTLGMLGSGFASKLHLNGIKRVYGIECNYSAFSTMESDQNRILEFQNEYKIPVRYETFEQMLKDKNLDAISLCTPTATHPTQIVQAMNAGKDVICEKPLAGFCAVDSNEEWKKKISARFMYESVLEQLSSIENVIKSSGKQLFYAENWIYSPSIVRANALLAGSSSKLLSLRGIGFLGGSHTVDAASWSRTGGGVLMRIGCHAIAAVCYLKNQEYRRKHKTFRIDSVQCRTANLSDVMTKEEHKYINAHPIDVEDWAELIINFSDGTKGVISASDNVLGGLRFSLEIEANNLHLNCNLSSASQLTGFVPDGKILNNAFVKEKVETIEGFQEFCINEEITRGYLGEMQDFMECIINKSCPQSNFDIASETIKIIYAGYVSAEEDKTIFL